MRTKNKWVLIAVIALCVGIGLAAIGFFAGGIRGVFWGRNGIQVSHGGGEETMELEQFSSISISVSSARVDLIPSDRNYLEYNFSGGENLEKCGVEGGTLIIDTRGSFGFNLFGGWNNYLKVYYDKDQAFGQVTVHNTSGSIHVTDIKSNEAVELTNTSGSVKAYNVTAATELTLKSTSGSVLGEGIKGQTVSARSGSGSVHVNGVTAPGSLLLKSTSGGVTLENADANNIEATSVSGSVKVSGTLKGTILAKSTSGSVKVYTSLSQSEYDYEVDSLSGSTRVNENKFSGSVLEGKPNKITAKSTSGSVRVYFEQTM